MRDPGFRLSRRFVCGPPAGRPLSSDLPTSLQPADSFATTRRLIRFNPPTRDYYVYRYTTRYCCRLRIHDSFLPSSSLSFSPVHLQHSTLGASVCRFWEPRKYLTTLSAFLRLRQGCCQSGVVAAVARPTQFCSSSSPLCLAHRLLTIATHVTQPVCHLFVLRSALYLNRVIAVRRLMDTAGAREVALHYIYQSHLVP